jgi:3-hydroxyacyl-CoA dehydrogenase/enoyl-CoA hydratase/3-hydroxybutyryl-CoA epimerase
MQGYEGPTGHGLTGFIARARELAEKYGERFAPTDRLVEMAEKGESFPA